MAETSHIDKSVASNPKELVANPWVVYARRAGAGLLAVFGDLFAAICALVIAALWVVNIVASQQQTDLSPVRGNLSRLIAQGFDGATTDIGALDLQWYPSRDGVVFTARDVEVFDRDGRTVQTLPLFKAGVSVSDLRALGSGARPELRDLELVGGEVTWIERADGSLTVGLGTPDTVGRFGPIYSGRTPLERGPAGQRPEILNAFRSLSIRESTAYVVNETNGLSLTVDLESLRGSLDGDAVSIDLSGSVTQDGETADATLRLRSPDALQTLSLDGSFANVRLDLLGPERGRAAPLRGIATPIGVAGSGIYSRENGLRAAEIDVTLGTGTIDLAGDNRALRSAALTATFDPDAEVMRIGNVDIDSALVSLTGSGVMREIGRLYDGDVGTSPQFDVKLRNGSLDLTPTFAAPLVLGPSSVKGRLDIDSETLRLDAVSLGFDGYTLNAEAVVTTREDGLETLSVKGASQGAFGADALLALWPVKFADGARRWIERSIVGGQINRLAFDVDLDEAFFIDPKLTSERLQLAFDVSGGEVRYIETMPLLTDAVASGRVVGNALDLTLSTGRIDNVVLQGGDVSIPQLMPRGGHILINATGMAETSELLSLVNNEPFRYLDTYGIEAEGFGGTGNISLSVKRPLLEFFDRELIEYSVKGTFTDASAPFRVGDFGLTGADVNFRGGKDGLFLSGPANLGPWRAQIDWAERYGRDGEPTRYSVSGTMDQKVMDGLGLGLRQVFGGSLAVRADAIGSGVNIESATVMVDMTAADMTLGEAWSKVAGERAILNAELIRDQDGFNLPKLDVSAPGLVLSGSAAFRGDYALRGAVLDVLKIDGLVDTGAVLGRSSDGKALTLDIDGRWLDVSPYVRSALDRTGSAPSIPLQLSGRVDELVLSEGYSLSDTIIDYDNDGEAVRSFQLSGARPSGPFLASLDPGEGGQSRVVAADVPDMSELARAVTGLNSTRGGRLSVSAELPLPGEPGAMIGTGRIDAFEVVDAPFLAQILSLASLSGLFDTLSGSGLSFDAMEMDFALREGSLAVRDARLYGPALGMTGEGDIALDDRQIDFSGTLVPAYTANSLLGDIPIIGDVFVGREGEGIFALTYSVDGPYEAAQISVNPLSALTPGFLRGIFRKKRDDIPDSVAEDIAAVRPGAED